MTDRAPKVRVILVNWNGKEDTLECLHSLESVNYEDLSVLVVDNGSVGDDIDAIQRQFPGVPILQNDQNLGFAVANNQGIAYALEDGADYVLLLNNDTTVDPDFLEIMICAGEENPDFGILSPIIYSYHDGTKMWFGSSRRVRLLTGNLIAPRKENASSEDGSLVPSQVVTGAAMLIKRTVIEKVGLLPTAYFLGWEDYDYCLQAERSGVRVGCVRGARVFHKVSRSFAQWDTTDRHRRTWLYRRGQVIFLGRNAPAWKLLPALLGTIVHSLVELIRTFGDDRGSTGPPGLSMAFRGMISGFVSLCEGGGR